MINDEFLSIILDSSNQSRAMKRYNAKIAKCIEKQIPKKVITVDSVPHQRCPSCHNAIKVYCTDTEYPYCQYCGQRLVRLRKGDD